MRIIILLINLFLYLFFLFTIKVSDISIDERFQNHAFIYIEFKYHFANFKILTAPRITKAKTMPPIARSGHLLSRK